MAKANVLDMLYTKKKSALEFNFDMLTAPPLLSLVSPQDIYELNRIARSVKLSGKIDEKYRLIDNIMTNRGFVKLHAGTNRVVYRFIEDQRFVAKIAVDKVGLGDNPAEFKNQFLLKPFVTKVFEVSPCGTIAITERVDAIMSREEFMSVADSVFNLMTKVFVGKYVLEDVGTHYFMNYGLRNGFGPVLLDFPYVFELDGNKLYCNAHPTGRPDIQCGGQLDYDDGFNNLICTKCNRHYHARDLKKAEKEELIIIGGKKTMKVKVKVGSEVIKDSSKKKIAKVIDPEPEVKKPKVSVNVPKAAIFNKTTAETAAITVEEVNDTRAVAAPVMDDLVYRGNGNPSVPIENAKEENVVTVELSKEVNEMVENEKVTEYEDEYPEDDYDEYDDEDDEEMDYDQYLSNRERKQNRQIEKQNRRTDFGDF